MTTQPLSALTMLLSRHTKRREFIMLLGGAAAWPLAARAQQGERIRRIGVLMHLAADDPEGQARHATFLQGLQQSGWTVGRNLRIDTRWGANEADRRRYAAELVALSAGARRPRSESHPGSVDCPPSECGPISPANAARVS